jgi:hypothetical protein
MKNLNLDCREILLRERVRNNLIHRSSTLSVSLDTETRNRFIWVICFGYEYARCHTFNIRGCQSTNNVITSSEIKRKSVKIFSATHGTRTFTQIRRWAMYWAKLIQSKSLHPILRSVLILSSHILLRVSNLLQACYMQCQFHSHWFMMSTNYEAHSHGFFSTFKNTVSRGLHDILSMKVCKGFTTM